MKILIFYKIILYITLCDPQIDLIIKTNYLCQTYSKLEPRPTLGSQTQESCTRNLGWNRGQPKKQDYLGFLAWV